MFVIIGVIVMRNESEDIPINIKDVFEVCDLIFKMTILLTQQLLQTHH